MNLKYSYGTDIGRVRSHNEDAVCIFKNDHVIIAAVCDGMGGHTAGDVASNMAMAQLSDKFHTELTFEDSDSAKAWITEVLERVNQDIIKYAKAQKVVTMGTTLVLAIITKNFIAVANIGDSRGYVMAFDYINQITKDHTFVRELLDRGKISPRAAKLHPRKNVINNALGANTQLRFDFLVIHHYRMDALILTSDGLTGFVDDNDILEIIKKPLEVEEKVRELIDTANLNGGRDNISVALIEFNKGGGKLW